VKFKDLTQTIFNEIKPKLENNLGLSIFANGKAKFEGWLKVELCGSLLKYFKDVAPERNRIDVTFDKWAIELKTITSLKRLNDHTFRLRSKDIPSIIHDIKKLKSTDYDHKAVLFVVFPIAHDNRDWSKQLKKILHLLSEIEHVDFNFKNKIPGVIYFGLIKNFTARIAI
jgi:hypothetical protein